MTRRTSLIRASRIAGLAAVLGAVSLSAATADAGALQVIDTAGMLQPSEIATLQARAASYPFDVRIVTNAAIPTPDAFSAFVGGHVNAPNVVVVGLNPAYRRTSVHFGVGTRIAQSYYRAIENAGDPYFRARQWGAGIDAILTSATRYVGVPGATMPTYGTPGYVPQYGAPGYVPQYGAQPGYRYNYNYNRPVYTPASVDSGNSRTFVWVGLAVLAGIVVLVFFAVRRASRAASASGYGSGPYRSDGTPFGPSPTGAGYNNGYGAPVQGGNGGISPLGAGLAGAAVGGLAGYAIGRAVSGGDGYYHDGHYHNGGYHDGGTYTATDPVIDNSGSSSSAFDSGGASSYDAGGSTSDWSSGGGDWGGGGDSGGGGGDW